MFNVHNFRHAARRRAALACGLLCAWLALTPLLAQAGDAPAALAPGYTLDLQPVASGFEQPVDVVDPGDGSGRLFVIERLGRVRVVRDGQLLAQPFLDLTGQVANQTWEEGLFAIAFDPDYAHNGRFYITYAPTPNEWRLVRYTVSDNPDLADPASATILLSIAHNGDTHYAGQLQFGPDGYLWVTVGDGGGAFDPWGNAQNLGSLLGKVLRLDVAHGDLYAIPPDNPFVNTPGARPEVWAYGLRNPWRFSFDRATGDLWIGDVGQGNWEELDHQLAGDHGGENYGWPLMEGMQCSLVAPDCDPSRYTPPVAQFDHSQACAVTGGYVYRGAQAALSGVYLFGDFCTGTLMTLTPGGTPTTLLRTPMQLSSFGQDSAGELYVTDFLAGVVYHVVAVAEPARPVVARVEPQSMPGGGVACELHVRGWSFSSDAQVRFNGAPRATTFRDSSLLVAELTAADMDHPGPIAVTVVNGDGQTSAPLAFPVGSATAAGNDVELRWEREDAPVAQGATARAWLWGPSALTCPLVEPYADAPGGTRYVQYFDKSRMEVTDPNSNSDDLWHVTNGLLAKELITGALQLGDDLFEQHDPSTTPVAGDFTDQLGPTYATLTPLLDAAPAPLGAVITQRLARDGTLTQDAGLAARGVTVGYVDEVTQHAIAAPFWDYMNASGLVQQDGAYVLQPLFQNPFYATGRPLTEAYWATVTVAGTPQDVLLQCFERRCLTYTPANPPGWRVEAGNVGLHYYWWRYGTDPR